MFIVLPIVLPLGTTILGLYFTKKSYQELKILKKLKKKDNYSVNINDTEIINNIPIGSSKVITFTQSTPMHYTLFLERTENYYDDSCWSSDIHRNFNPHCKSKIKEYEPITQYHFNFFKKEELGILPTNYGCQVSLDSSFPFTQNELVGIELLSQLLKTIPEKDMYHFKKIEPCLTYVVRKYDFTNVQMYIYATRINSNLITYDLYGPNKKKLIDDKYEIEESNIQIKFNLSILITFGSVLYLANKFKKYLI